MKSTAKAEVNVQARNNLGRFISKVEMAGQNTVEDMVKEGAKLSRHLAPVGSRHDLRSIPLRESIFTQMYGRTRGMWGSSARHALPIEKGARRHLIPGDPFFRFFWENEGRWWIPGLFGEPDMISHPGNKAQPFLRPALTMVMAKWRQVAKKNYGKV